MSLIVRCLAFSLVVWGVLCACSDQTSAELCLVQNQNNVGTPYCVWDYSSARCSDDTCITYSNRPANCIAQSGCVMQPLSKTSQLCYSAQVSCSMLSTGLCGNQVLCQTVGSSCAFPLSFGASNVTLDQQCASFPMWSIALLIVWLVIMIIIGFIILLIFKQKRDDAITEVEQSEVRIDSVQINRDNFSPKNGNGLDRPLR